jgi:hypothetical protein
MATVNKDFKIKSGLVVEGLQGTINNQIILTEVAGDQYILDLIGGETLVKSVSDEFIVSGAGELSLDRSTVDAYYDAAGDADAAQAAAISAAALDATSKANAAQAAAEATAALDATSKANAAQAAAEATAALDATSKADAAEAAANLYTDGKVADLVDSAPELLDTLNELAEAIANNPNYATDVANLVATKADTTYVDQEISDLDTAAQGYASAAQSAAIAHADALTTSDVAEGTAQYFTDARAKTSAADLLVGATKTNITITGTGAGLVITAENGVADSTTSDLVEGTNLYFTNERAVDALEAVVPNFTAVEVNSVAKQVASTMSAASAGAHVGHAFAKADYRSAEFLVKIAYGTHTEISKVLLTLDSSDNIAMTEYGIVGTNGTASSISANVNGANVQLLVTTANNNSTVTVVGTLLA